MKNKYSFLVILFLGLSSFLFSQTADITQGCYPLSVQFTAPAGSGTFFWNFNDGATSLLQNPSNTFISGGNFVVEFSETVNGPVLGTVTVNVYDPPSPSFTSDVTGGCAPLSVNFSDNTTIDPGITVNGYSWVFGDGGTDSGTSAAHTFSSPGSFFVSLGISTNLPSCDVTEQFNNYINVSTPPNTSFTTSPNPAFSCTAPLTVDFNNNTTSPNPLTYSWDFGNGQTSNLENPPNQTYTTEGTFPVVLIATDDAGCESSSQINVGIGQPVASFEVADTLCLGEFTVINNLSPAGSYTWNFGPNANPPSSSSANPLVLFNAPGYQDIILTINGACPDDTTITVFIDDPTALFVSDPSYSCSDPMEVTFTPVTSGANYVWTFGDGQTSTDENPTIIYTVEDTTTYSVNGPHDDVNYFETTLVLTTNAGCVAEYELTDTLHQPNALALPDVVEGCAPLLVNFSDTSISNEDIVEWEYIFGDGGSVTTNVDLGTSNTYSSAGEYEFYSIITNAAGCVDTSFIQIIEVGEMITPNFTVDVTEICPGETIQFTDLTAASDIVNIDSWHYYTEDNHSFHCFQENNPEWTYEYETGPQDVTLMVEYNGCYSTFTQSGLVNVLGPIADMSYNCDCENPFTIEFINNSHDATEYLWDFGDGETSTEFNPTHTYLSTGDYEVTLQAINTTTGCDDSFITYTVHIRDLEANFVVDDFLCQNVGSPLNGNISNDVYANCYKGYTYFFSDPAIRPITSANSDVSVPFPNTGPIEIFLEVTDINGCKDTISNSAIVYGIEAEFNFEPELETDQICFPSDVFFSDLSSSDTTITEWNWMFGDGLTGMGDTISHTFYSATYFEEPADQDTVLVTLEITNAIGCTSTEEEYIFVYSPVSQVSYSDNTICSGTMVNFNATDFTSMGSNLTFNWDFDNGSTSIEQNPSQTFDSAGTYFVTLAYEEISTGCRDTTEVSISVADYPIAGFQSEADSLPVICPNDNVLFMDTSIFTLGLGSSYLWNFGNGNTSTFADPGTAYPNNGTYTVELIVEVPAPYGCADTTSQDYTVYGPIGDFITDLEGESICRLDEVLFTIDPTSEVDTFYWDFGDGTVAPGTSPISHQYTYVPPSGQTYAIMVMSNDDGSCPTTEETLINIHEVVSDFDRNFNDVDTALCFAPYPLTNLSLNGTNFYWDFGDGTSSSAENPMTHSYPEPGTYEITLGILNAEWGCTDTISKGVVLYPIPDIAALGDSICEGEIGFLTVPDPHPIWEYTWTTSSSYPVLDPTDPSTSAQPLLSASYNVLVTDTNDCTNNTTVPLIVFNGLVLDDFETIVPLGDTVTFPLNVNLDLYDYTWTPGDTENTCLICDPPWVQAILEQTYQVEITDKEGCFTNTANFTVNIHPETFVSLPTTFTPNGDGVNDIIFVEGWGIKELLEYTIYNRWGEKIFESSDMNDGWDGYYKGVLQNNDIYVYKVSAKTWRDEVRSIEGHINLMR